MGCSENSPDTNSGERQQNFIHDSEYEGKESRAMSADAPQPSAVGYHETIPMTGCLRSFALQHATETGWHPRPKLSAAMDRVFHHAPVPVNEFEDTFGSSDLALVR